MAKIKEQGLEPSMPDVGEAEYLVQLFYELGLGVQSSMGTSPASWLEISSWLEVSSIHLTYWEVITLKEMSQAYASELSNATTKNRPPPYVAKTKVIEPDKFNADLLGFLRSLAKK